MRLFAATLAVTAALAAPVAAQVPAGYPASYADIVAGAAREGRLVVYSTTDERSAQPTLNDFKALYPKITVDYSNLNSTELYNRTISEAAAKAKSADMVWTGGMDTGLRLAADGYAVEYASPEIPNLPAWAVWKNTAYGTTSEPLVFLYNKRALQGDLVPQSHSDLLKLLQTRQDVFKGKIGMLDPARTAGLAQNVYDAQHMPDFWELVKAMGANEIKLQTSSGKLIEQIGSGETVMAINVFGSYAHLQVTRNQSFGMVIPTDYTLTSSRIAYVQKSAANPNAARLFLDYLLSKRGQQIMADVSKLYPARKDVGGEASGSFVAEKLGDKLKPIPINEDMLARVMGQESRLAFIKQFQDTLRAK